MYKKHDFFGNVIIYYWLVTKAVLLKYIEICWLIFVLSLVVEFGFRYQAAVFSSSYHIQLVGFFFVCKGYKWITEGNKERDKDIFPFKLYFGV